MRKAEKPKDQTQKAYRNYLRRSAYEYFLQKELEHYNTGDLDKKAAFEAGLLGNIDVKSKYQKAIANHNQLAEKLDYYRENFHPIQVDDIFSNGKPVSEIPEGLLKQLEKQLTENLDVKMSSFFDQVMLFRELFEIFRFRGLIGDYAAGGVHFFQGQSTNVNYRFLLAPPQREKISEMDIQELAKRVAEQKEINLES